MWGDIMPNCNECKKPIYDGGRKYCMGCRKIANAKLTKAKKDAAKVEVPCDRCGAGFMKIRNARYCAPCKKILDTRFCNECFTAEAMKGEQYCRPCKIGRRDGADDTCLTCDNKVIGLRKYCDGCRKINSQKAQKRQSRARKQAAMVLKLKPSKDGGGVINPKFLTRGKIKYEGLGKL